MRHTALAATALYLTLASTSPSVAVPPQGDWPEYAYGHTLDRPDWVLLVAARRHEDGSISIWDRDDPWTRLWTVPSIEGGLRVVGLMGDSEDGRYIDARSVDAMIVDEMRPVMDKYGARALALVVTSTEGIALAAWSPGSRATWRSLPPMEGEAARDAVLDEILVTFSTASAREAPPAAEPEPYLGPSSDGPARLVALVGERDMGDATDYLVDLSGLPGTSRGRALDDLSAISARPVEVLSGARVVVTLPSGTDPYRTIERAGFVVE